MSTMRAPPRRCRLGTVSPLCRGNPGRSRRHVARPGRGGEAVYESSQTPRGLPSDRTERAVTCNPAETTEDERKRRSPPPQFLKILTTVSQLVKLCSAECVVFETETRRCPGLECHLVSSSYCQRDVYGVQTAAEHLRCDHHHTIKARYMQNANVFKINQMWQM